MRIVIVMGTTMEFNSDWAFSGILVGAVLLAVGVLIVLSRRFVRERKAVIHQRMAQAGLHTEWVDEELHGEYRGYPVVVRMTAPDGDEGAAISMQLANLPDGRFTLTNIDLKKLIISIDRTFSERDGLREMRRVKLGLPVFDRYYYLLSKPPALIVELLRRNTKLFNTLLLERRGLNITLRGRSLLIHPFAPDDRRLTGADWQHYLNIGYEIAHTLEQMETAGPDAQLDVQLDAQRLAGVPASSAD